MNTHALLATALLGLLGSSTVAQTSLPKMDLHWQSLDGNASDIVGPEVSVDPFFERVWGFQGRDREVWRVDDRVRQVFEEDKDFGTKLTWGAIDLVSGLPPEHRLFTLTQRQVQTTETGTITLPARIKVDDIFDPTAPVTLQELDFPLTEAPRHIATDPERNKLVVVMDNELRIYDYSTGTLPDPLVTSAVAPIPPGLTSCGVSQTLSKLGFAMVADLPNGMGQDERMAIVAASVDDPQCIEDTQLAAILVCNIENPTAPFFYSVNMLKQVWHPCRPPTDPCSDWRFHGFTHLRTSGLNPRDLVYVVGGADIGLTQLDVTDVAISTIGIVQNATYSINAADTLFDVEADPQAATGSDYLYIIGRQYAYVVDRAHLGVGQYFKQTPAGFGNGPAGDAQFMLADPGGAGRREIWSLAMQQARYVFRVTDFTQVGLPPLEFPDASEGYHSAGPTDSAVASFGWESVYNLTFGGVVRYDISGSEPVPAGYAPAFDPDEPAGEQEFTTEHMELVNFGTSGSPDWKLIAGTAEGNFYSWAVDPTTHDPLQTPVGSTTQGIHQPPPNYWPAWDGTYGNDIAVGTHPTTGQKYVFFDYSDPPTGPIGIGRYNWTMNQWPGSALTWTDPTPGVGADIKPNCRDLAFGGTKWLLAAANGGFLVIDALAWQVTDYVYTNSVDGLGLSYASVMGIEMDGNRIFASLGDPTNRFALAMYGFNSTTGKVVNLLGQQTDLPLQVLYDDHAPGGKPDNFPGIFLDGGERMSLIQTVSSPKKLRLYSGTGNGYLLEIEWQESTNTMTPLSYWHNGGYFDSIASCDVYKTAVPTGGFAFGPVPDFTLRIVVGKTTETFEIVSPPDMP